MNSSLPAPGTLWIWANGRETFIVVASPGVLDVYTSNNAVKSVDVLWNNGTVSYVSEYWFDEDDVIGVNRFGASYRKNCCRLLA